MRVKGPPPAPAKYARPVGIERLRRFQLDSKLIVEGFFHGRHRSPFHDFASEFADYRAYVPGDEIRSIDWRAYARTDRFYIKLYRKETDMSCIFVVDKSRSMGFSGDGSLTKLEYGAFIASALSHLAIWHGDKAGLALCDHEMRTFIPPGGTVQALQRSMIALARSEADGTTKLGACLQTVFGLAKRKGLLVVISDFLDDVDGVFSALNMFTHKGFSVLLFQVLTPEELLLPNTSNALFLDSESQASLAAEPDSIRKAYQEQIDAFVDDVRSKAKARRMHYQLVDTSQPYDKVLETYLTTRTRL